MSFNSTIALALRYAPQIGTPDAATTPTLALCTEMWADATTRTEAAFRKALLADSGQTGMALQRAKEIEALYCSGSCLLSKGSIGKDARATSDMLLRRADDLSADLKVNRRMWLTQGASAESWGTNPFVKNQQVDDGDPDFDHTAGTGDVPYADNDLWPYSTDDL